MARAKRRLSLGWPAAAALVLLAAAGLLIFKAERKLSRLALGGLGESFSTRVYAAPFSIDGRRPVSAEALRLRLSRLRYRSVAKPSRPGEYSWQPPALRVHLRGFSEPAPAQAAGLFSLTLSEDGFWTIQDGDGALVERAALEPELAAELSGPKKVRREPAAWEEIPQNLKDAVVAAEDKRFFSHFGLDPRAIVRSTWHNATESKELRGGSTITQQLVKNLFLTSRRTLRRKVAEAALSVYLELRLSKERILAVYLNHIYMGQEGPVSIAGVKSAARFYFGKDVRDLDLPESAMLAGLIRSPLRYNPRREPAAAKGRRDFILKRMKEEGFITSAAAHRAAASRVKVVALQAAEEKHDNDYFTAEVVREALPHYGEETLFRQGLSLHTTMDPLLQKAAQDSLRRLKHQGALVALDPRTGSVLALAGGKDFTESQFNRATQARRQPGSAFKPFLYGAALEAHFTAASVLEDKPTDYAGTAAGSQRWRPGNYGGVYFGTTTLRTALSKSLNSASLHLASKVGPGRVVEFAHRMGVESAVEETLAVALGASEVSLLELTCAYAPFANGGFRTPPHLIASVYDAEGQVLEYTRFERESVLEPPLAFLLTDLLRTVVTEGTAQGLPGLGWTRPSAGKTGTTNDGRDAWFIGYTPDLLTGVWVGDDKARSINATGAKDALPIWAVFMNEAASGPAADFAQPEGLVSALIDPLSGFLARAGCPARREELFLQGTEPLTDCPVHAAGIMGWFKRLFGTP